jgi:hypothetical protein
VDHQRQVAGGHPEQLAAAPDLADGPALQRGERRLGGLQGRRLPLGDALDRPTGDRAREALGEGLQLRQLRQGAASDPSLYSPG